MPAISVVIPALNEGKYITTCLDSFKNQTFQDYEIIVSDGNSTDNTVEIAKKYTNRIVVGHNTNVCDARSNGFKIAKGTIVTGADADTFYPKDHLQNIYNEFQKNREVVAVTGNAKVVDAPWWGTLIWKIIYWTIGIWYKLSGTVLYAPAYNLSFNREAFLSIGGYNTRIDFGGDELDVLRRLKKVGKAVFCPLLHPETSGRRYTVGFLTFFFKHLLYYYWFNYITGRYFGKSRVRAKPVR